MENPALVALIVSLCLGTGYVLGALFSAIRHRDIERRIWRDAERLFAARLRQEQTDRQPCTPKKPWAKHGMKPTHESLRH